MNSSKELRNIDFTFYSKKNELRIDFFYTIKIFFDHFQQNILINPCHLDIIKGGKTTSYNIDKLDCKVLTISNEEECDFVFKTLEEEYKITVSLGRFFYYVVVDFQPSFILNLLSSPQICLFLQKGIISFDALSYAYSIGNSYPSFLYRDFDFTGRNSSFTGFTWLLYLSNEEVAKNGGEALLKIPHLTHVERLPEGVLFQVGDSPLDALTPEGEEQLYLATKAWCDIVGCSKPLFRLP